MQSSALNIYAMVGAALDRYESTVRLFIFIAPKLDFVLQPCRTQKRSDHDEPPDSSYVLNLPYTNTETLLSTPRELRLLSKRSSISYLETSLFLANACVFASCLCSIQGKRESNTVYYDILYQTRLTLRE